MTPEIRKRFNAFIKMKGLRHTPQRNAIVEIIFASDEHFTPDELWEKLRGTDNRTSRATLYRTLSLLSEAGLLQEIDLGDGQTTYDPNFLEKPAHNHLVCVDCGKIIEFKSELIEDTQEKIAVEYGFKVLRHRHELYGHCSNCDNPS